MSQTTSSEVAASRPLVTSSFFGPTLHPAVARLVGGRRGMVAVAMTLAAVRKAVRSDRTGAAAGD